MGEKLEEEVMTQRLVGQGTKSGLLSQGKSWRAS